MSRFVGWLVDQHGNAPTPTGDLAREFGGLLAESDELAELRRSLEYYVGPESWALEVFDDAWMVFSALPTCSSPGCEAKAAGGASSYCPEHGGRSHQGGPT